MKKSTRTSNNLNRKKNSSKSSILQRGYKSDSREHITAHKKKRNFKEPDKKYKPIYCLTQFDFQEDDQKKSKAKRNKSVNAINSNNKSEFRMQTRSMNRKNNNPEESEKLEEISLNSESSELCSPIKVEMPKKNKRRGKSKKIKKEKHNNEEIEIVDNSMFSFKKEYKYEEYSVKNSEKIKEEVFSGHDIFGDKKRINKMKASKKSKSKSKSKRSNSRNTVRTQGQNIIIPIFNYDQGTQEAEKKPIKRDKKESQNKRNKTKKSSFDKDEPKRGKTKEKIKKENFVASPKKCTKNYNKRNLFKVENDRDPLSNFSSDRKKQKPALKEKKGKKQRSKSIKNIKDKEVDSTSYNFSSTNITTKSEQNTPSFNNKIVNIKQIEKISQQLGKVHLSFLEETLSPSFNVILKKGPIDEVNTIDMTNANSNFTIVVKKSQLCEDIDVLGHKRKRSIKKENKPGQHNIEKYLSPQNKNEYKELELVDISKIINKSTSIIPKIRTKNKKAKQKKEEKPRKTRKNENKEKSKPQYHNKRIEKKKQCSVKKKRGGRKKKCEEIEKDDGLISIRSKSLDDRNENDRILIDSDDDADDFFKIWKEDKYEEDNDNKINYNKCDEDNDNKINNNNNKIIISPIKKEFKEDDFLFPNNGLNNFKIKDEDKKNNKINIIKSNNIESKKSSRKSEESLKGALLSDSAPELESPFKKLNYITSSEPNLNLSFSLDTEPNLIIKKDPDYFLENSGYIKYCPMDKYIQPIPEDERLPITSRITKNTRLNSFDFTDISFEDPEINSDTDLIALATYDGSSELKSPDDLPPILNIPRIKPVKEEHSKLIKEKLKKDGINIFKTDNDKVREEEKKIYAGSFLLYDKKNDIKVNVPIYKDSDYVKNWFAKKNLKIIDFAEDNDVDTDEEQLKLEMQRNHEALEEFCRKVEEDPNYIDNNLKRKRLV